MKYKILVSITLIVSLGLAITVPLFFNTSHELTQIRDEFSRLEITSTSDFDRAATMQAHADETRQALEVNLGVSQEHGTAVAATATQDSIEAAQLLGEVQDNNATQIANSIATQSALAQNLNTARIQQEAVAATATQSIVIAATQLAEMQVQNATALAIQTQQADTLLLADSQLDLQANQLDAQTEQLLAWETLTESYIFEIDDKIHFSFDFPVGWIIIPDSEEQSLVITPSLEVLTNLNDNGFLSDGEILIAIDWIGNEFVTLEEALKNNLEEKSERLADEPQNITIAGYPALSYQPIGGKFGNGINHSYEYLIQLPEGIIYSKIILDETEGQKLLGQTLLKSFAIINTTITLDSQVTFDFPDTDISGALNYPDGWIFESPEMLSTQNLRITSSVQVVDDYSERGVIPEGEAIWFMGLVTPEFQGNATTPRQVIQQWITSFPNESAISEPVDLLINHWVSARQEMKDPNENSYVLYIIEMNDEFIFVIYLFGDKSLLPVGDTIFEQMSLTSASNTEPDLSDYLTSEQILKISPPDFTLSVKYPSGWIFKEQVGTTNDSVILLGYNSYQAYSHLSDQTLANDDFVIFISTLNGQFPNVSPREVLDLDVANGYWEL